MVSSAFTMHSTGAWQVVSRFYEVMYRNSVASRPHELFGVSDYGTVS